MNKTIQNICKSCKCQVPKVELDEINKQILTSNKEIIHDNQLILCNVCFPWYKISHCAPKTVLGFEIKNPKVFMRESIRLQNLLSEHWMENCGTLDGVLRSKPICDNEWFQFLQMVITEKRRTRKLNEYMNIDKILDKKSGLTYKDICSKVMQHLCYLESESIDERALEEEGWGDYASEIVWPTLDKLTIDESTFVIEKNCDNKIRIKEVNNEKFDQDDYPLFSGQFSSFLYETIIEGRQHEVLEDLKQAVYIDSLLSKVFGCLDIPLNAQLQREVYSIIQGYAPKVERYRFLALWSILDKIHTETNIRHDVTNLWVENPAWEKSFQLFRSVIKGLGRVVKPTVSGFRILGNSGAIYTVEPNEFLDWNQPWVVKKKGGNGKKICIDVTMSMPLGDMLCSLALSLRDDLNSMKHIHTLNPNVRQEDGYGALHELFRN